MSQRLGLQLFSWLPAMCRSLQNKAALRPIPKPRSDISTPVDLLKAIGRSADTKVEASQWEDLFKLDGPALKKAGLAVRDRRYVLWSLEKYRQGQNPADFAHPPTPKKKIRGWGPKVQFGKRIRSRRHR